MAVRRWLKVFVCGWNNFENRSVFGDIKGKSILYLVDSVTFSHYDGAI